MTEAAHPNPAGTVTGASILEGARTAGYTAGAADTECAIVAWLRERDLALRTEFPESAMTAASFANAIDRGDYGRTTTPPAGGTNG